VQGTNLKTPASTFKMDGAVDAATGRSRLVLTTSGSVIALKCTYITEQDTVYTSVHPSRRAQIGAAWVRSSAGTIIAASAFQFRPEQLYEDPERTFGKLERSGTGEVRGVKTTEYSGELDLSSLVSRKDASPLPEQLRLGLPTVLSFDEEGRLVRLTFDLRPPGTSAPVSYTSTMDLFDYGKPVEIEVPTDAKDGSPSDAATACFPGAN
jgi:hypothetical protein